MHMCSFLSLSRLFSSLLFLAIGSASLLIGAQADAAGPSFDCNNAATEIEKAICGDSELARLDAGLSELYFFFHNDEALTDEARGKLGSGQKAWLQERDTVCKKGHDEPLKECIARFYKARIAELKGEDFLPAAKVEGVYLSDGGASASGCISFEPTVKPTARFRPLDYLHITPAADIDAFESDGRLCMQGFEWGHDYEVTVRAGVPLKYDIKTTVKHHFQVSVPDAGPSIAFAGKGHILAAQSDAALPLLTRNVERVSLKVIRIVDRALIERIRYNSAFGRTLDGADVEYITRDDGEFVWEGEIEVDAPRNSLTRTGVPLKDVIDTSEPGVHIVVAENPDEELSRYSNRPTRWLLVSDLGITSFKSDEGLSVFVNSHATTQPVAGARVVLLARSNRILGESTTGSDGRTDFAGGLLKGSGSATPTAIMVYAGEADFNLLTLNSSATDLSDNGIAGRTAPGPIDAFVYGDRDIYRPGETLKAAALVRDDASLAITGLPVSFSLIRPDGQVFASKKADEAGAGLVTASFDLPRNLPTGRWRLDLHVDPEKPAVGSATVSIEDFVPERLAMDLKPDRGFISQDEVVNVALEGRFLFGAPAAGLDITTDLVLEHDPRPYTEFSDYTFGLVTDRWTTTRLAGDPAVTDDEGKAVLSHRISSFKDTTQPLRLRFNATLLEPGGRGITRSTTVKFRPRDLAIGIRPGFEEAKSEQEVTFDVVALNSKGEQVSDKGLVWELVRENRDYHWERVGSSWEWRVSINPETIDQGTFKTSGAPMALATSVDWGWYRLEVYDQQSGAASSHRFHAGWWGVSENSDAPDRVRVGLDAESYKAGSTALLRIDPPYAGTALVTVLGDGVLRTERLAVDEGGAEIALEVEDDWGVAGAYVAVTLLRSGSNERAPKRAIGITWLKFDRTERTLNVAIDAPEKALPNQLLEVPLTISGLAEGEQAFVTLAAVDQGILSLTDYATPDPAKHYYGQRLLAVELRDSYGALLDPQFDRLARIRSGGDAAGRQNTGLEVDAYETVALFSGALEVGADGRVIVPLDLPDFNGSLRLMAVAASKTKIGKGETNMIVRAPIIAEISRPRFLAAGDEAQLELELYNLDAEPGATKISLAAAGSVSLQPQSFDLELLEGEKARRQVMLKAEREGVGMVTLQVEGPGGVSIERSFEVAVRPVSAVTSDRRVVTLSPGGTMAIDSDLMAGFKAETQKVSVVAGAGPTFDLPHLISSLYYYPYGCLEQTVSSTLPLLYLSSLSDYSGLETDTVKLTEKINHSINHLLTMQRGDGSFGLWSSRSNTEVWLSVYAFDFMTRARAEGYAVPDLAYDKTKRWIEGQLLERGRDNFTERTANKAGAYALYAMARAGASDPSILRYWATREDTTPSALDDAALLTAISLTGQAQPERLANFSPLVPQDRDWGSYDYGSPVRDAAMQLVLLSEAGAKDAELLDLAAGIANLVRKESYLSTQEKAWLSLAGKVMIDRYGPVTLGVAGEEQRSERPITVAVSPSDIEKGLEFENRGDVPLVVTLLSSGVPVAPLPAKESGFSVERSFYGLDGEEVAADKPLQQGERYVVILSGEAASAVEQQALVVDLLPAGLEIENTRLAHGGSLKDFSWIGVLSKPVHMELRDDRFVAAVDLDEEEDDFRVAYIVRAVTPGHYIWPASYVEDMYRPDRFARGAAGTLDVSGR